MLVGLSPYGYTLTATTAISPPRLGMLVIEPFRALFELAQTQFVSSQAGTGQGDGHAVVLFPGLGADHTYMAPLAKHCERLGYTTHHWGRGRNTGPAGSPTAWLRDLASDVAELIGHHREKVSLIGWSLGGLYAREVAKALPSRVRQVITLGTPSANLADATNVGWLYELLSGASNEISRRLAIALKTPPPVPTTSIYSRSDGVVAWRSCRVRGPQTQNVEVESSHLGLVWHPEVLRVVAERLGQDEQKSTDSTRLRDVGRPLRDCSDGRGKRRE